MVRQTDRLPPWLQPSPTLWGSRERREDGLCLSVTGAGDSLPGAGVTASGVRQGKGSLKPGGAPLQHALHAWHPPGTLQYCLPHTRPGARGPRANGVCVRPDMRTGRVCACLVCTDSTRAPNIAEAPAETACTHPHSVPHVLAVWTASAHMDHHGPCLH